MSVSLTNKENATNPAKRVATASKVPVISSKNANLNLDQGLGPFSGKKNKKVTAPKPLVEKSKAPQAPAEERDPPEVASQDVTADMDLEPVEPVEPVEQEAKEPEAKESKSSQPRKKHSDEVRAEKKHKNKMKRHTSLTVRHRHLKNRMSDSYMHGFRHGTLHRVLCKAGVLRQRHHLASVANAILISAIYSLGEAAGHVTACAKRKVVTPRAAAYAGQFVINRKLYTVPMDNKSKQT